MSLDTKEELFKSRELDQKKEALKNIQFAEKLNLVIQEGLVNEFKTGASQLVSKYVKTDDIIDILPSDANKELDQLVDEILIEHEINIGEQV